MAVIPSSFEIDVHTSIGIVRPGDKLVLAYSHPLSLDQAELIKTRIRDQLPGVEPVIIQADALVVYRQ